MPLRVRASAEKRARECIEHDGCMPDLLEWWPDYGRQLLHLRDGPGGSVVPLERLPLSPGTLTALREWLSAYDDDKLPVDGPGDPMWLERGIDLLAQCRAELQPGYEVVVTEPWWGETPSEY